jgi:aspartate kinase
MKVFKFGGASVSTVDRIKGVASILERFSGEQLVVVISAMGKTTNALEGVVNAFYDGARQEALDRFEAIKQEHIHMATQLMGMPIPQLLDYFTEVEWLLHDKPVKSYDYYYDQVVCIGELLSTCIMSHYLNSAGVKNILVDVRDVLRTDNNFRDARVDWEVTAEKLREQVLPLYEQTTIVITQGFIGSTDENESTTLGREGSDYTAAIFANLMNAESQTIWKDVQGVMNADPKLYSGAQWIKELNYREVIEMAYYGAQVIHPKTIKPLQNKNIPLVVKSFINPQEKGTIIHSQNVDHLPPIIVYKDNQVLVQLSSRDFSFVGEGLTAEIYRIFQNLKLKPNLTQNAAISLMCVLDDRSDKIERFALKAAEHFDVQLMKNLTLLTIRHYNDEIIQELCGSKNVLLRQQTPETLQMLMQA